MILLNLLANWVCVWRGAIKMLQLVPRRIQKQRDVYEIRNSEMNLQIDVK